jgi:hypothetical protein
MRFFTLRTLSIIILIMSQLAEVSGKVAATIEYACFPAEGGGGRLFLVIGVDGSTLQYQKTKNNMFQATASFAIAVND